MVVEEAVFGRKSIRLCIAKSRSLYKKIRSVVGFLSNNTQDIGSIQFTQVIDFDHVALAVKPHISIHNFFQF